MAPTDETHLLSDGTRDMNRDASGHADFYHRGPTESRRVPPSGHVSPNGKQVWPQPSTTSRLVVYGGIALAAAGGTAGLLMLIDKLTDKPEHTDPTPKRESKQPVVEVARPPRPATPRKKRRRSPVGIMEFATTIRDATAMLSAAMVGFRTVAQYADGISKQFHDAADSIRNQASSEDKKL